ncbi:MAG: FAD-binding oxidoreductase [Planctomycetota bacterium]|nr:MAG: FAD-binding oxidoreductase [Planctomycetota bacterium]
MAESFRAALSRILPSDRILDDEVSLLTYECDAYPIQKGLPAAVVFPETTSEVLALVQAARKAQVALLPRGAGTCLSGGASPGAEPPLLIETSRMRQVLSIDYDDRVAVVQPGLVNLRLGEITEEHGFTFAPDPSSQKASTLGGNVALNAGGPHCFKYGMTSDHVLGMTMVTGRGELLHTRAGNGLDLTGLLTGSEGTFGILTEIELRLSPAPECTETWLAAFPSMAAACRAVAEIVRAGLVPAALEILDRLTIQAVEASSYAAGYPTDAEAVLLVELDGAKTRVDAESPGIQAQLKRQQPLSLESTRDPEQRLRLWKGRKGAFGAMGRVKPNLFVLDGVVPRSKLEAVLAEITEICKRKNITLANVFHAGDGNLHPNLSFDGRDPVETERAVQAGREILELCVREGGSLTGEHGVGVEKKDSMPAMFDDTTLAVFADLRKAFDPELICNPGKLLPSGAACNEGRSAEHTSALEGGAE